MTDARLKDHPGERVLTISGKGHFGFGETHPNAFTLNEALAARGRSLTTISLDSPPSPGTEDNGNDQRSAQAASDVGLSVPTAYRITPGSHRTRRADIGIFVPADVPTPPPGRDLTPDERRIFGHTGLEEQHDSGRSGVIDVPLPDGGTGKLLVITDKDGKVRESRYHDGVSPDRTVNVSNKTYDSDLWTYYSDPREGSQNYILWVRMTSLC